MIGCSNSEIVGEDARAENPSQPSNNCGKSGLGVELLGWTAQLWQWNLCGEGFYEGKEVWAPVYAEGFYQSFHFSRIEDWNEQKLVGESTRNVQTFGPSDPGQATVKEATEEVLGEPESLPGRWVQWVLEGQKGPNPLMTTPSEEFGPLSPDIPKCFSGKPVNCATGNEVESQTDLIVGGRGPGLRMTRTYNAQLAAKQGVAGIFGYGWTCSYSAHVELSEEQKRPFTRTMAAQLGSCGPANNGFQLARLCGRRWSQKKADTLIRCRIRPSCGSIRQGGWLARLIVMVIPLQ